MKYKKIFFSFKKRKDIIKALLSRGEEQRHLFEFAREVRDKIFSKRVEVRSVIEYSNICQQICNYCAMSRYSKIKRYILDNDGVLKKISTLYTNGRRVIMFQTGENQSDSFFNSLRNLLKEVKENYPNLTLICCLGNLSRDKYRKLRDIGVERYILKFEVSDPRLYKKIKPLDSLKNRLNHIRILKKLGFQVGSGNISGLPGQSLDILANDLILLKKLNLSMGSTSIFIPNDRSNYAGCPIGDIQLALNFVAILRIMCPEILIPSTTSLELAIKNGQYLGLMAGANSVTLHDGTPGNKQEDFVIYKTERYKPTKALSKIVKKMGLEYFEGSLIS